MKPLARQQQPWTDESVSRFWAYETQRNRDDSWYFSRQYGPALLEIARRTGGLRGQVLDYSAARGHLIDLLLEERDVQGVRGVEFTAESVAALNGRFQSRPKWQGALWLSQWLGEHSVRHQMVFCIEVIEHLDDRYLAEVFQQIYEALLPGGLAILSTPHAECLEQSFVYCPFCESEFHAVQHVRSITRDSLAEWLRRADFDVMSCDACDLGKLAMCQQGRPWRDWSYNYLKRAARYRLLRCQDKYQTGQLERLLKWLRTPQGPHLLAIARKK